jgi:polysaccharide export outer membrane protein
MSIRRSLAVLLLLALRGGLVRAQSQPSEPPPAPPTKVEAPKVPASMPADSPGVAVDPRTYVIGPEDILSIKTWREPDFTFMAAVRPDGKITVPLINDIQAEGLTPDRLSNQLKEALSTYINKPEITISVMQVNSKKFFISGQVNRPGQYPLVVETHVFDALNAAGGFRDFANTKNITIIRGDKRFKFNYNDVLKGKKLDQNILLESGDTIYVP